MRKVPPGTHRRPHPDWPRGWEHWLGRPGADGSILLGTSRPLTGHLMHRFFPATGEWPQDIYGWVNGIQWLLDTHRGHEATSDRGTAEEAGYVWDGAVLDRGAESRRAR